MVRMMRDVSAALSMRMLPVRNNKSSFLLSSDSAISLQLQFVLYASAGFQFFFCHICLSKYKNNNLNGYNSEEHGEWIYIRIAYCWRICRSLLTYVSQGRRVGVGTCQYAE